MNNSNMGGNSASLPTGREEAGKLENGGLPCHTAHIRPFVSFRDGSSILKVSKDRSFEQKGGGIREKVSGFSRQSRRRLMNTIGGVRRDAEFPNFVTLTYPDNFPSVEQSKRDLKVFLQRLERKFTAAGWIWKLEPQERGAPHFHMLVWGCETKELYRWVSDNWYQIAGQGDINAYLFLLGALRGSKPCVTKVRTFKGVWNYAGKYLGKTFEVAEWGNKWTGRYWGVGRRKNIPFGKERKLSITLDEASKLMRSMRRHVRIRGRDRNSMTIYCDADQWNRNLISTA